MKSSDLQKTGRPKVIDGDGSRVSTWVPEAVHDRIVQAAGAQSVSSVIRRVLESAFPPKNS
jgi:hypothetical protein